MVLLSLLASSFLLYDLAADTLLFMACRTFPAVVLPNDEQNSEKTGKEILHIKIKFISQQETQTKYEQQTIRFKKIMFQAWDLERLKETENGAGSRPQVFPNFMLVCVYTHYKDQNFLFGTNFQSKVWKISCLTLIPRIYHLLFLACIIFIKIYLCTSMLWVTQRT